MTESILKRKKPSSCDLEMSGINFPRGLTEISVMPLVKFTTLTVRSETLKTSQNPLYPKY